MKKIVFFVVLISIIISSKCYSQEAFHYGIKGGIGFYKFVPLETEEEIGGYPKNTYHLSLAASLFIENKLTDRLSIVSELSYKYCKTERTVYTSIEGILNQKIIMKYLNIPILVKYEIPLLWSTYIYGGPSFNYLLKASCDYYDRRFEYGGNLDLKNELPKLSISAELGIGKEFSISQIIFLAEIRTVLNVTKYKYETINYKINNWRNLGLELLIGCKL
jgi:hypothetical protein